MTKNFHLRPAQREDVASLHAMIQELADYEKLSADVQATAADLEANLFATPAKLFCQVAEGENGPLIGFVLFFYNYSTFRGRHGLYIEDLFVRATERGNGAGKALFEFVLNRARQEGLGRVEFTVLDWNTPAIEFYRTFGAEGLTDWTTWRVSLPSPE
jgi:diamine N-acetyltransferase